LSGGGNPRRILEQAGGLTPCQPAYKLKKKEDNIIKIYEIKAQIASLRNELNVEFESKKKPKKRR